MRTPFHESLMFSFACVPHRFLHAVFPQGKGFYPYQPIVSLSLMFTTFTRLYVSRFTASYARFLFSLSLLSWLRFATPLYRIGKGISIAPLPPYFSDLNPSNVVGRRKAKGQVPTRPKTTTNKIPQTRTRRPQGQVVSVQAPLAITQRLRFLIRKNGRLSVSPSSPKCLLICSCIEEERKSLKMYL